ncbi:MAG TPA: DUF3040 domain-containing protein [Acidimicrobiales bacterium]
MPLSEDEQKILHQIEQQFLEHDPVLAGELENTTLWRHALNRMKWATAAFVLGVVVLIVALATATSFVVAFGGFVVMLAATLWFERNARKLGRAGWEHVSGSARTGGLRDYLGGTQQRMRDRFNRDD